MRCIEKYKRLKDDQQQSKGKAPATSQYPKDPRQRGFQPRPRRDLRIQEPNARAWEVNIAFKELVHKILERIKHEPFFQWLSKIGGDSSRRNQNLYCTYQKDKGHIIEQCRILKDHLEQLVNSRHLKEFVLELRSGQTGQTTRPRGNTLPPLLGVIEVIHVASMGTLVTQRTRVLIVVLAKSN